jgi:hypothetical protein
MAAAASPSDLSVKVGAGSSEFVFPEDRNRYRCYHHSLSSGRSALMSNVSLASFSSFGRGGLMLDSGDWLTDYSPERQPQQKSFEIMKPRLSRVQLPTYVHTLIVLVLLL